MQCMDERKERTVLQILAKYALPPDEIMAIIDIVVTYPHGVDFYKHVLKQLLQNSNSSSLSEEWIHKLNQYLL